MPDDWSLGLVLSVSDAQAEIGFSDDAIPNGILTLKAVRWAREYIEGEDEQGPAIVGVNQVLKIGDLVMVKAQTIAPYYSLKQIPNVQGALIAMDPHTGRVLAMQGGWKYKYGHSEFNRATLPSASRDQRLSPSSTKRRWIMALRRQLLCWMRLL